MRLTIVLFFLVAAQTTLGYTEAWLTETQGSNETLPTSAVDQLSWAARLSSWVRESIVVNLCNIASPESLVQHVRKILLLSPDTPA